MFVCERETGRQTNLVLSGNIAPLDYRNWNLHPLFNPSPKWRCTAAR